ncbi:MAG TPA: hypothetical protein VFF79_13620 [Conexibacter sp.]|jgi:hypothetical protein|nr:hypothetical protein [Conexibacter sp.]
MRRRLIGVLAAAALVVGAPGLGTASAQHTTSPAAQAACVHAKIGGKRKCIARGQYCARRYEREYERYGFTCSKRDRRGRWHLQ